MLDDDGGAVMVMVMVAVVAKEVGEDLTITATWSVGQWC